MLRRCAVRGAGRHGPRLVLARGLHASRPSEDGAGQSEQEVKGVDPGGRRKYQGQNFPELLEHWSRPLFYRVGYASTAGAAALTYLTARGMMDPNHTHLLSFMCYPASTAVFDLLVVGYWYRGLQDIKQNRQAIRTNFPVLGNIRYLLESVRPEIRQYFIESETDATPYDRAHRSIVYQRAKNCVDTLPLGTRRDVYSEGYEWIGHSMWPKHMDPAAMRATIGGPDCKHLYSASVLNISAMSYGALSQNAISALNKGAKLGGFYHNTGEGGISRFHKEPGGDIVWNVGTGYFGCRTKDGQFCPEMFVETASLPQVKMIEVKLSQGAKPGHGGILPKAKLTDLIREARGLDMDHDEDVNSPPNHSAFGSAVELMQFIGQMRELSDGKPIGFKLCVGRPEEVAAMARAMVETGITPDFITVDGGEGGTGAAPPEFSNSVGMPMLEGLSLVHSFLVGAGLRDRVKIIASGRVLSGFSVVRNIALGADVCNAARAFMFSLGCIQALKCNTNKCPTGIATQDLALQVGLDPADKAVRVYNYHRHTVHAAAEIIGAAGYDDPALLQPRDIYKRLAGGDGVMTYKMLTPRVQPGELLQTPDWQATMYDEDGDGIGDDLVVKTSFYGGSTPPGDSLPPNYYFHRWWAMAGKGMNATAARSSTVS